MILINYILGIFKNHNILMMTHVSVSKTTQDHFFPESPLLVLTFFSIFSDPSVSFDYFGSVSDFLLVFLLGILTIFLSTWSLLGVKSTNFFDFNDVSTYTGLTFWKI